MERRRRSVQRPGDSGVLSRVVRPDRLPSGEALYENRPDRLSRIEVVADETAHILRGKTGAERLAMANDMFNSARRMLLSHLAAEHPDWSAEEVARETARRISHGLV